MTITKIFKPITTDSSHGLPVYPNLLEDCPGHALVHGAVRKDRPLGDDGRGHYGI